jgi:RNA polymerase sigma-70 factor (ECF subfamily)
MQLSGAELREVLAKVGHGDASAFATLYRATSMKLFGIILRILGRRDIADEVLQEVYLRVWQQARGYDPSIASPITWLATIARNRALDERRKKLPQSIEDVPALAELASGEDIAADHELADEVQRLLSCVNGLEPERRRILMAVYFGGMSGEEIAAELGIPSSTVRTWLRRSLAHLKVCLEQ